MLVRKGFRKLLCLGVQTHSLSISAHDTITIEAVLRRIFCASLTNVEF